MARQPRIEYEGAVYHVMARGLRGDLIYRDDHDRKQFIKLIGETVEKTGWRIHAYVLMGNHFHFLLTTPEANLSWGMQWLQGTYAKRFKARHQLIGPVFNNRFKSPLIQSGDAEYFLTVSSYIHLNPARAGLLSDEDPVLSGYRWSSFPAYVERPSRRPGWLDCSDVLGGHGPPGDTPAGRRRYREWLEQRARACVNGQEDEDQSRWDTLRRAWFYGTAEFRQELLERLDGVIGSHRRSSYQGEILRSHDEAAARDLLARAMAALDLNETDLPQLKKSDPRKQAVTWVIKRRTAMTDSWIIEVLDMGSRPMIHHAVKRFEQASEKPIKQLKRRLLKDLSI